MARKLPKRALQRSVDIVSLSLRVDRVNLFLHVEPFLGLLDHVIGIVRYVLDLAVEKVGQATQTSDFCDFTTVLALEGGGVSELPFSFPTASCTIGLRRPISPTMKVASRQSIC